MIRGLDVRTGVLPRTSRGSALCLPVVKRRRCYRNFRNARDAGA